ncbi:hypothetical protein [Microlunatus phosphovorus]|nr:hypothetical protein [Microlunatus phosphovorus]
MATTNRLGRRMLASAIALVLVGVVGGCSDGQAPSVSQQGGRTTPKPSSSPATPESADTTKPPKNDLRKLPRRRSLETGPISVEAEYDTTLPIEDWRADTTKPLRITLTASNDRKRKQKIYLTRVTIAATSYDESGPLDVPQPIIDAASVQPGYIVTSPNTYSQNFDIPAVNREAVRVGIDLTYEFLLEVNQGEEGRDLAKQVATDRLSVPIAGS